MNREPLALLLALTALACLSLGAWLSQRFSSWKARVRGRAYNERGQRGEHAAGRLLHTHGYSVCARKVEMRYPVEVDGQDVDVLLHADYLVVRGGKRYVAEVKTGRNAPRFEHAETRRRLLEYQLAFDVESVLLVDVEARAVRVVRFPLASQPARGTAHVWLMASAVLGLCVYWLAWP